MAEGRLDAAGVNRGGSGRVGRDRVDRVGRSNIAGECRRAGCIHYEAGRRGAIGVVIDCRAEGDVRRVDHGIGTEFDRVLVVLRSGGRDSSGHIDDSSRECPAVGQHRLVVHLRVALEDSEDSDLPVEGVEAESSTSVATHVRFADRSDTEAIAAGDSCNIT